MGRAEEKYKDNKFDDSLQNGPTDNRSCTDIICCILFIAALVLQLVILSMALSSGKPSYLFGIYDSDGRACGLDAGVKDYPYAYFSRPSPDNITKTMEYTLCVKQCPDNSTTQLDCAQTSVNKTQLCTGYKLGTFSKSLLGSLSSQTIIYPTSLVFDRICMPGKELLAIAGGLQTKLQSTVGAAQKAINDVLIAYYVLLLSFLIAIIIGLIYMLVLRICAGVLVFITIVLYLTLLTVIGILFLQKSMVNDDPKTDNSDLQYVAYFFFALAAISALIICCKRDAIRLAVAIVKTAGSFIMDCKTVLLVPVVGQLAFLLIFFLWTLGFIYVYAMGTPQKQASYPFAEFKKNDMEVYAFWYWIFMGLWKQAFIACTVQFVIASATAIWYFSQGSGQLIVMPVGKSVYRAFRYHLGSLAFGSLLLAIVRFIRLILAYMEKQAEKMGGNNNAAAKFVLKCLQCYMACFERFIEFLNKNAYIQMAISGKNFCKSALEAFVLMVRNPARFAIVGVLGSMFTLLGVLIVFACVSVFGYIMLTTGSMKEKLSSPFLPLLICVWIGYAVAKMFMSIYQMSIDTILQCFLLDEELHKQNPNYNGNSPQTIKDIMGDIDNRNKK